MADVKNLTVELLENVLVALTHHPVEFCYQYVCREMREGGRGHHTGECRDARAVALRALEAGVVPFGWDDTPGFIERQKEILKDPEKKR